MITVDDGGGEGGKNCQNIDYVICERPLIKTAPSRTNRSVMSWKYVHNGVMRPCNIMPKI